MGEEREEAGSFAALGMKLVAHGFGIHFYALGGEAHDERQRHEARDDHGKQGKSVFVGKHAGLADHLLIGGADGDLVGG